MNFPEVNAEILEQIAPVLILFAGGLIFLVWGALEKGISRLQHILAIVFYLIVLGYVAKIAGTSPWPVLNGMLLMDSFSLYFVGIVVLCSIGAVISLRGYLQRFNLARSELLALIFFASSGMVVLVSAYNLVSLFLGLELMSLSIYVMVGFRRRDGLSNEAVLKYFLLGAFSIAFFLYGVSIIYGLLGTTNYRGIAVEVMARGLASNPAFLLAITLLLAGFAFKVSLVPFHMWVPDVYQGAPTPVTLFMATAVKAASFGAFLRLFYMCFMMDRARWALVLWVIAVLTMTLGNIVALVQRNMKRMMAYSGIAHAGYLLVGFVSLSLDNLQAASGIMYYLLAYAFMNLGAFALIGAVEKKGGLRGLEIDDYAGLGLERPFLGLAMSVFILSLAGIPPTAGFFAKYYIFGAAVAKGYVGLAVIAVLNSVISLYYYLRVIVVMYMHKSPEPVRVGDDLGVRLVLLVSMLAILWLGIGPGAGRIPGVDTLIEWTRISAARIVGQG